MVALHRKLNNKFSDNLIKQYVKYLPHPCVHTMEYLSNALGVKGISYEQETLNTDFKWRKRYDTFTIHHKDSTTEIMFVMDRPLGIIKLNIYYKDSITSLEIHNYKYYNFKGWQHE